MPETSTPRTLRHQQRYQVLVQLAERAMARNPKVAALFAAEMSGVLADDPAFAALFAERFRQPQRGALPSLVASPLITALNNVQNLTSNVQNVSGNVQNAAANALNISPLVISGGSPLGLSPHPSPTPPKGEWEDSHPAAPSTKLITDKPTSNGRSRDYHWDALERVFGPCRTKAERDQRNVACKQFRDSEVAPQEIQQIAERWKAKMGTVVMTPNSMVKYAGQVLEGPQLGSHVQTLYETATVKHRPKFRSADD